MATDKKITELTEIDALIAADIFPMVDDPSGSPATKKSTFQKLADWLASLTQTLTNKTLDLVSNTINNLPLNNLLKNGNFINNSTDGYGGTPDDWTSSSANPVQGGIPTLTKAQLISITGVSDGDIEGLWPLNEASGNATDLSSNSYDLTDTNTVLYSKDGLMAQARDFIAANTEYFTIADASCANLEITGSQTWIAFGRADIIGSGADRCLLGKRDASSGNINDLYFDGNAKGAFRLTGLTTNSSIYSDVVLEAGKWYMVIGVYDSANTKLKIWVNGIKKEVTASGSTTDTDGDFSIGRLGKSAANYFDGLIQNACVLSVALSDDQVKRLWAYTTYKSQKIRRDSTDALLYQDLPQDLVERLRGKQVTLRAKVYAGSTNHRIYLYDGITTTEMSPSAANAWETISVTATIGADATSIRVGLEADTTDGNMWIKEVALYEGGDLIPYDHSKEDWNRFPRLLKLDPPAVLTGYEYEENRWFPWTPVLTGGDADLSGYTLARFTIKNKTAFFEFYASGKTVSGSAGSIWVTLPVSTVQTVLNIPCEVYDGSAWGLAIANNATTHLAVQKTAAKGNWVGNEAGIYISVSGLYEID